MKTGGWPGGLTHGHLTHGHLSHGPRRSSGRQKGSKSEAPQLVQVETVQGGEAELVLQKVGCLVS